tara:strand:+ start:175 stop:435 length:261 start_codon:yes stop_codon:yes gene_type:complete
MIDQEELEKIMSRVFLIVEYVYKNPITEDLANFYKDNPKFEIEDAMARLPGLNHQLVDLSYTVEHLIEGAEERGRIKESKQRGGVR